MKETGTVSELIAFRNKSKLWSVHKMAVVFIVTPRYEQTYLRSQSVSLKNLIYVYEIMFWCLPELCTTVE